MIRALGLCKVFGKLTAVSDFSCDLPTGSTVGLLGANGAGKTTVMRMLAGALPPTAGCIFIGGHDVFLHPQKTKRLIGYLPEIPPLYPEMRVIDYLQYMAKLKGMSLKQRKHKVWQVMADCRLEQMAKCKISRLSRGFCQRTGLAQALLANPPALIVDEPTSALDPLQIKDTRELLKGLKQHKTILVSTHILSEIEQLCDHVIILQRGSIVLQGTLSELLRENKIVLEAKADPHLLGNALSKLEGVKAIAHILPEFELEATSDIRSQIWELCRQRNWPIVKMDYLKKSLECVYLQSTREEKIV